MHHTISATPHTLSLHRQRQCASRQTHHTRSPIPAQYIAHPPMHTSFHELPTTHNAPVCIPTQISSVSFQGYHNHLSSGGTTTTRDAIRRVRCPARNLPSVAAGMVTEACCCIIYTHTPWELQQTAISGATNCCNSSRETLKRAVIDFNKIITGWQ